MSLLGRKTKTGLIFLLALFLFYCEDPNEIGLELRTDSDKVGAFYTEIDLKTSVISLDSILTSSSARLLTGSYLNPDLGAITASGYSRFSYGNTKLNIPDSAVYDSIYLNLNVDYVYGPGVSEVQTFTVHELTEEIIDTLAYFNFSDIGYNIDAIGSGSFLLPEDEDTLLFYKLSDDYGKTLFNAAIDTTMIDPDDVSTLHELFRGFAFLSDPANNLLLRYNQESDESGLQLYYHKPGDTIQSSYEFKFFTTANFNRIISDRTGTPLEGINNQPYTEFIPSDNKTYIQSGTGLIPKLDMSPILDFFDSIPNVALNRVIFDFKINDPGFNESPPSSVTLYFTDEDNRRIRSGPEFLGVTIEGASDLARPAYDNELNNYIAFTTLYTGNILTGINQYQQILLYPPEFGLSLTVNHFQIEPGNIKAKIYYTRLK